MICVSVLAFVLVLWVLCFCLTFVFVLWVLCFCFHFCVSVVGIVFMSGVVGIVFLFSLLCLCCGNCVSVLFLSATVSTSFHRHVSKSR